MAKRPPGHLGYVKGMKNPLAGILIPGIVSVAGVVLVALWTVTGPVEPLQVRNPGLDGAPSVDSVVESTRPVVGEPTPSDGQASKLSGAWPCFRGQDFDAVCKDGVPLARRWPEGGPEKLWPRPLQMGQGYAAAAVKNGCVYVLDYDEQARADTMRCLSLDDGKEIWRNSYPVVVPWNHGMSRTVPAAVGKYVISLGPKCHVVCWDAQTGQAYWLLDLVIDYGATVPQWYAGQCPLIDNDRLILAPGGEALLIAVDYKTGELIWKSGNPRRWVMTHSSIVPMEFAGRRMYVYCGTGGVAGVAADDGSILWDTTAWRISMATCPSPVVVGDGRIFLCGGYNSGAMVLQLKQQDGRIVAETLFRLTPRQFSSEQQTPVLFEDHLYGVRQKDKQLVCLDLNGSEAWNSGKDKFGAAPYIIADGLIYVMSDSGLLTMAEATPQAYRPLGRAQVIDDGHDSWGPMALVAGRLIVRDMTRMVCLNVAENNHRRVVKGNPKCALDPLLTQAARSSAR